MKTRTCRDRDHLVGTFDIQYTMFRNLYYLKIRHYSIMKARAMCINSRTIDRVVGRLAAEL